MPRLHRVSWAVLAAASLAPPLACSPADKSDTHRAGATAAQTAWAAPTAGETAAQAVVERCYAEHFKRGQGFSVATLRTRQDWFAPTLYSLMLADMTPTGEVGYIEADPFTDAQEEAATFQVGAPMTAHDTVLVPVEVAFGVATGNGHEHRRVTLAMVPAPSGWQIANVIYADHDLLTGLRSAPLVPNAARP